jgi:hypothetical protein
VAVLQRLVQGRLRERLDEVLEALDRAGVVAVPLKGPVLGERLYGDQSLRVSSDLDVLVGAERLGDAQGALVALGYGSEPESARRGPRAHQHHITLSGPEGIAVELHFRLISGFGALVPAREFLDRATLYRSPNRGEYRVLSGEDELIYLLTHAAGHLFERLAWLYDVKMLLARTPRLDLAAATVRARELGLGPVFTFALETLRQQLGGEVPEPGPAARLGRLRRATATRLLEVARAARPGGAWTRVLEHLFRATLCDGPVTTIGYLGWQGIRAAVRPWSTR